jgi:pilin isopeptide linkage protein
MEPDKTVKTLTGTSNNTGVVSDSNRVNFDNSLSLNKSVITLKGKKVLNASRAAEIGNGEFSFVVAEKGEIKTTSSTKAGGDLEFSFEVTQDDIGTHYYVISEVKPDDADEDGVKNHIAYTASPVVAKVVISEDGNGGLACSAPEYEAGSFDGDVPLFINEYEATGSYTLTGDKFLRSPTGSYLTVREGQFNFTVKEGSMVVATGSTRAGGEIYFTPIEYIASDIGTHTYTISEEKGGELFQNYDASSVEVTLEVYDVDGSGVLGVRNVSVDGAADAQIEFTNTCTYVINTGITFDLLPYIFVLIAAVGFGIMLIISGLRRRKY